MAKYTRFEELPVWQDSAKLYNLALDAMDALRKVGLSGSFCNQFDRATLSISNNVAEGFERATTGELLGFLAIARGSAGEVRSMITVILKRPACQAIAQELERIRALAESCSRQLTAWRSSIEASDVQGKRQLTPDAREQKERRDYARDSKRQFFLSLDPKHPLYNPAEAREARAAAQHE